jgi:Transposase DDE domain
VPAQRPDPCRLPNRLRGWAGDLPWWPHHADYFIRQQRPAGGFRTQDLCGVSAPAAPLHRQNGRADLHFQPHYHETQAARARQVTHAFKEAYAWHRPGVEGCWSALVRGHGIRICRYIGRAKNHLRALFSGVVVNLARAAAWRAGRRHRPKRLGLTLTPVASG